ncbi:MAG: FAD-binding protein [Chitinophagales bacterium]|nr:FAD-binding protein [Chitinophagales bacterium]
MQHRSNFLFKNWAGNFTSVAANYFQPETETEIAEVVRSSNKIRLTGTGHSWSDICLSNHTLLNLDRYNKVLYCDKANLQVTVQAGIKLWQLNEYLDKQGLALKNLGSIAEQSVAGAISTGTHGSGINYQILASQIEQFALIKPDGNRVTIHHKNDKNFFDTSVVNLGALGVISELTLNVAPSFRLHDQTYVADFDKVIDCLDELVNTTDHFKLWWFPHVEKVVVYRYTRTQETPNDSRLRQWLMDEFLSVNVYRLFLKIGNINRNWRRNINRALVTKFVQPLNRIEKSYRVFNVPKPPVHRETEYAFDLNVAKELLREYKRMINTSEHRINFLQEIRFTKADDYTLSPCYGRNTMWLGAYNADNYGWDKLLADFEQLAMQYNGRPHWGKEFNVPPQYIKQQYPLFAEFEKLRSEIDPEDKFVNDYINRFFCS